MRLIGIFSAGKNGLRRSHWHKRRRHRNRVYTGRGVGLRKHARISAKQKKSCSVGTGFFHDFCFSQRDVTNSVNSSTLELNENTLFILK